MEQLILVKTIRALNELELHLHNSEFIAFDTETTGLDKESEVIGFSVYANVGVAYYVVLAYWDVTEQKLQYLETREYATKFLKSLVNKSLIMHNAVFDCWKIETAFGVELMPSVHTDTMVLAHVLDENRPIGLKDLGVVLYGENAKKEQEEMKASVKKNGGQLTKVHYELYKADCDLIGKYGAKDTILTLKLFHTLVPDLFDQGLDTFFYDEESMPLLRGPTYEMNTTGLRIDPEALQTLKSTLEAECMESMAFVHKEIESYIKDEYPATSKKTTFNVTSTQQLSWLLFHKLGNGFRILTNAGKELCEAMNTKLPYNAAAKRDFIKMCQDMKDLVYKPAEVNKKTGGMVREKKIVNYWTYLSSDKETLQIYADKYRWVRKLLEYKKNMKLLSVYVKGIQSRVKYNIIRPSFLQHGTTSGRYSSRNPNFTNLPRDDKRVKACIVPRKGNVFVGADYSQLEPRVFASFSKDERLLKSFADGDDFYSVIGAGVFNKKDCTLKKDDSADSFAVKYKALRHIAKVIALATPYGTTAFKMASSLGKTVDEAQAIIDNYFASYPGVLQLMLESHEQAKTLGYTTNLFGRPRRMPEALTIKDNYGADTTHGELPYKIRNILNLAMNHRIQSTAASITNRAMIALYNSIRESGISDCKIVLMVHDSIVVECAESDGDKVAELLKNAMENTVQLPGIKLLAEPKIGKNMSEV